MQASSADVRVLLNFSVVFPGVIPWIPEVFLARFPMLVVSLLRPARETSGAERDFFESAEPMTSQFKST